MDVEEEIDYDNDINYDVEYEDLMTDNNINEKPILDYEIIEPDQIMKNRESLIAEFMECSCLSYDEAELVLNHFNWNYDKLSEVWFDNMEEIKMDSHIDQSPESIVSITEYYENNQLFENTCILCGNVKTNEEDFIYLKCEHKTCINCMGTYLLDVLFSEQKNVLSTYCPLKCCNLYVTRSIYKKCIKDEALLEIYEESIKNIFMNKNKNIRKCPNKSCNLFIKSRVNTSKEIKCKCGHIFCFSCQEEPHSPCFCEMIKHWNLMANEIKFGNDSPKTKPFARCPKCGDQITKKTMTNHIKCECDEEFCYNCGYKWIDHNNNCYDNVEGKNRIYKFYAIVNNIDNDISFSHGLKIKIDNYINDLRKKYSLIYDVECLNEIFDLIVDYYKFFKYLTIFRYFLYNDVDDNFLNYNFSFLYTQINKALDLLEFDTIENLLNIPDLLEFKNQYNIFKEKIFGSIKSIKIFKNNIISEIEKNICGKIDYKLLEEPIDSINWCNVITSEKPVHSIINIVKSNDFSFFSNKRKSIYKFIYNGINISEDDEFIMKLYSHGYAFQMTKYLRTGSMDKSSYYGSISEKEMKSSICCLQHAIFRNSNVKNGQVVYRAIKTFRFPTYIKINSKFYFREFLSTSTNEKFSFNWLQGKGTFLIITITNNGTDGHKNYCYYIEDITVCKQQYEVIFACHCSFILNKIERTQNIDYVYLTCEGYLFD